MMWPKSIIALFGGLFVSVSMMLSLYLSVSMAVDTKLLLGLLLGFIIWVAVMLYCYSFNSAKACAIAYGKLLALSLLITVVLYGCKSPL